MIGEKLSKRERHDAILAEIRINSAIRVSELAQRLHVAGETIRRDLSELSDAGLVSRTYGGATAKPFTYEPEVGERGQTLVGERARIGLAAAKRIPDGQVVMIAGGSTTLQVALNLARVSKDVSVLSNSLPVATTLAANPTFRVTLAPGVLNANEMSVTGAETVEFFRRHNANLAVISASALSPEGPCETESGLAAVQRVMIERADETILVADHSKFGQKAYEIVASFKTVRLIISDREPPPAMKAVLDSFGTRVLVV